mmetsp:Transcript_38080/g.100756  ORF Transcript_38080/g.100756 Transcript_38080/m.100756 type:complete len:253 (+) Transcript_38080:52-810(+)
MTMAQGPRKATRKNVDDVLEALCAIGSRRREIAETSVEWAKLDKQEAEVMRQYAKHVAQARPYDTAIGQYLAEAIRLDESRADLYLERARYRMEQHGASLQQDLEDGSEASAQLLARIMEDVKMALERDEVSSQAYELALPLLFAHGDLDVAERLAQRGQGAVGDLKIAMDLGLEFRRARNLRKNLGMAEALLSIDAAEPAEVERIVAKIRQADGARLPAPVRRRLEECERRAGVQRQLEEACRRAPRRASV